ncbi:MAG: hypothetical protein ACPG4N_03935 [Gammaproteobacteria bacterium]
MHKVFFYVLCLLCTPITLAAPSAEDRAAELNQLFEELKNAPNEMEALQTEEKIWIHWTQTGDPAFDEPMDQVLRARRVSDFDKALDILEKLKASYPDNAEVWNQIATIRFFRGDLEGSLEAVAETLAREPRHFGSLAGRANIRLKQAKPALAIQNLNEALKVHPFLRERHWFPRPK